MWVPSIASQMLGVPVRFSKRTMMSFKHWHEKILIYLLKNLFLSITTLETMSTYFLIVDAPTLNQLAMYVTLNPWANQ
jgi:hypothetical protein